MAAVVSFYDDEPVEPSSTSTAIVRVEQMPIDKADDFEVCNAEIGVAYVRHPVRRERLLPLASYHADIVIEKTNDAISMLTALGASRIELAYSNKISSEAKADVEALFGLIRFQTTVERDENVNVIYNASGEGADPRPLPSLLWIGEPGWQGIVDGRVHGGMREFALSFGYDHRTDVDADLHAAVKRFGLRAGGSFRKALKVDFSLQGTFPPLAMTALPSQ